MGVGDHPAMTFLAAIALRPPRLAGSARRRGWLLRYPAVAASAVALAIGEMVDDKQTTAPDRIGPIGLLARFITSAVVGAVLPSGGRRWLGPLVGGSTGVVPSYPGWRARKEVVPRFG
jgi:uncharacterized membrane protein